MSSMMLSNLIDNMKNMSLENMDPFYWAAQACPVLSSPVDWKETCDAHVFAVDLPGVSKDAVKVEVEDGNVLHISGDRGAPPPPPAAAAAGGEVWHRIERSRGKFSRRFELPENARGGEVKAEMENGVLKVIVPKVEVTKPEKKVVEIEEK